MARVSENVQKSKKHHKMLPSLAEKYMDRKPRFGIDYLSVCRGCNRLAGWVGAPRLFLRPPLPAHQEQLRPSRAHVLIARSGKLHRARSRLYRNQILQENMRLKALAEIYTMHSFAQFWNLIFCQNFANLLILFAKFEKFSKI